RSGRARLRLASPRVLGAEQLEEPLVRFDEVLLHTAAGVRVEARVAGGVVVLSSRKREGRQAEGAEHPVEDLLRIGVERLALEDQELLSRKQREPQAQLLLVTPAGEVRVVLVHEAVVERVPEQAPHLRFEALGLALEGLLEGKLLVAPRYLVLMVR